MTDPYGLLARFETADALIKGIHGLRDAGYRELEAYAPYPVKGLAEALEQKAPWVPIAALATAVLVPALVYYMQWYSATVAYPFVVGGKPLHSWPAFLLVSVVWLLLAAVAAAVLAMLAGNRLPELYHPVFNVAAFARASDDGLFLLVRATDKHFEAGDTGRRLENLGAAEVAEVPE